MIRRLPAALVVALAALLLTAGCSGSSDTTRNAAVANDHELSNSFFTDAAASIGAQSNPVQLVDGEVSGDFARSLLTEWVHSALLTDALAEQGLVVDDATRSAAAAHIEERNSEEWAELTPEGQQFLTDLQAPLELISSSDLFVSEEQIRDAYEAGAASSGIFCLRAIVAPDQAAAEEVEAQLGAGADFATLADQYPIDAANLNGGVFADPQTLTDCTATSTLSAEYAQQIASAAIGEPTNPIDVSGRFVFFLQRPFDEVAEDVRAKLGPSLSSDAAAELTKGQDARVDTRYGRWDTETGTVVAAA